MIKEKVFQNVQKQNESFFYSWKGCELVAFIR